MLDTVPTFDSPYLTNFTHSNSYSGWSVSDLFYGKTYYWKVRGRNDNDTSIWTGTRSFTTKNYGVTLQSPLNGATGISTTKSLYINKITGSENYDYQIDTVSTFDSPDLRTYTHSNSYSGWTVSNLRYGQKYYWRARGRNDNDSSPWTSAWSFTTLNQITPDTPNNNSVETTTSRSIICDYESGNTSADNYEFEMDTTANFNSPLHTIAHGQHYSSSWIYKYNSNLRYGTKYYWRVRVRNAADTSQWSVVWNFTTLDNITLDSPANNSIGRSINQTIICDYESGNTSPANYDFEVDTTENFNSPVLIAAHGDSYSSAWIFKYNSGLRYGQKYYWRARVRNANDTSQWSVVWNFKTDYELTDVPVLVSPANNSTGIPYTSFSIDWNGVTGANQYQYQISTTNDFTNIVRNGTTSLTDRTITNLQPNTLYYWRVRGENNSGYSNWSEIWNFTTETVTLTAPVLISPSNNATEIDYASVDFDWQDVFGANEYNFEISQDENFSTGVTSLTVNNSDNNLINLNNSTTYYWRVSATDGNTTSNWSAVWNFTTKDAPVTLDAPTLISPADYATDISTNPTLVWNAVSGATGYEYQYGTDYTFIINTEGTTTNTQISTSGLSYQTQYYWRVRATDGINTSNWSNVWSFTTEIETLDTPVLVSPGNNVTNQLTELTLDWNSVPNALEYEYQYSTDNSFTTYDGGTTSNTDIFISGLDYNTEYFWRVQAGDGTILSEWSEIWSFTTKSDASNINNISGNSINIYPNPASDFINVVSKQNINFDVYIYDINGKLLLQRNNSKNRINISNLKPGLYIIKVKNKGENVRRSIFVKE